jgi:hypothetical protein
MKFTLRKLLLAGSVLGASIAMVHAQPAGIPPGANTNCDPQAKADTLPFVPDSEGYSPLFNGKDFTGWWESCLSSHSTEKVFGGTWLVDAGTKSIFSAQRSDGSGSLLMTNQKFDNYELILDIWPDFGNDGGVFNRTTGDGKAYQTTIDYLSGSSVGGSYSEGIKDASGGTWNTDPVKFNSNESSVTVQTDNSWTALTKGLSPTTYGCPANGCTAADWTKVWDVNGWNQMRIKLYGGITSSQTHMEVWVRDLKTPNKPWVPMLNQVKTMSLAKNYIALQIHHGADRWSGTAGSWYRNIRWKPLTEAGSPPVDVAAKNAGNAPAGYRLSASPDYLQGASETDFAVTVRDLSGKVVDRFSGKAGSFRHALPEQAHGVLLVEFTSPRGVYHQRISRIR